MTLARLGEIVHQWMGWCPNAHTVSPYHSTNLNAIERTDTAGPDANGGPRNTGLFRVPLDMLGMLIAPIRTIRDSKEIPLSRILIWFAILIVLNSLFWGAVVHIGLSNLPVQEQPASLIWETAYLVSGLIIIAVLIIGISSCVLYGLGRVLGSHSGLQMTLRAVIYGITPVLLLFGAGGELQLLMSTIRSFNSDIIVGEALPWVFFLWAVILISLGLRELQGLSMPRALSAVVLPGAVFIVFLAWLLFTNPYNFFTFSMG